MDETQGEFIGNIKNDLNLAELNHDSFTKLLDGVNPSTGESLVASKQNRETNVPAFDFTLSSNKSLSIAVELAKFQGDYRLANELLKIHDDAVNETFNHIQSEHITTRVQKNKVKSKPKTNSLLAAKFMHSTNRSLEPMIHSHMVTFNFTNYINKFRALDMAKMLEPNSPLIKNIGEFYRQKLKETLEEKGYKTRVTDKSQTFFELDAVSPKIIDAFSSRRKMIEEKVKELKKDYPKMKRSEIYQKATLLTRVAKKTDLSRDEIRDINIELLKKHTNINKMLKSLQPQLRDKKIEVKKVNENELLNTIEKSKQEIKKYHRTPLNIATKTLSKLPSDSDIKIDDLFKKVQAIQEKEQKKLETMHDIVIVNLQATKLNTQKLFNRFEEIKNKDFVNIDRYQVEEIKENGKESDRVRAFTRAGKKPNRTTEANNSYVRDARDADREIDTPRKGGIRRGGTEPQRYDDSSDRVVRKDRKPTIITAKDIEIAENGYRKQKQKNKSQGHEL